MLENNPSSSRTGKGIRQDKEKLPPISDKFYFAIGEVGKLCHLEPHVLRYWEQEFPQLKPSKRSGNRRYYEAKDIVLVRCIKTLLYEEGYTIEGARALLSREESKQNRPEHYTQEFTNFIIAKLENLLEEMNSDVEEGVVS